MRTAAQFLDWQACGLLTWWACRPEAGTCPVYCRLERFIVAFAVERNPRKLSARESLSFYSVFDWNIGLSSIINQACGRDKSCWPANCTHCQSNRVA